MLRIGIAIWCILSYGVASVRTSAQILEEALAAEFGDLDDEDTAFNDNQTIAEEFGDLEDRGSNLNDNPPASFINPESPNGLDILLDYVRRSWARLKEKPLETMFPAEAGTIHKWITLTEVHVLPKCGKCDANLSTTPTLHRGVHFKVKLNNDNQGVEKRIGTQNEEYGKITHTWDTATGAWIKYPSEGWIRIGSRSSGNRLTANLADLVDIDRYLRNHLKVQRLKQARTPQTDEDIALDYLAYGSIAFVHRFLLNRLTEESQLEKRFFVPGDRHDVTNFLSAYVNWASEQNWPIVRKIPEIRTQEGREIPVVVVGDLHGHFASMRQAFKRWMTFLEENSHSYLVFLGNFVGLGVRDVETAIAILALQMFMNGRVIVLRGKTEHEPPVTQDDAIWSFPYSLARRFRGNSSGSGILGEDDLFLQEIAQEGELWDLFLKAFRTLPAAAIMTRDSQRYLMMHGGWSQEVLVNWQHFKNLPLSKLQSPVAQSFVKDLVWSAPSFQDFLKDKVSRANRSESLSYLRNAGGISAFGIRAVQQMMSIKKFDWIITGYGFHGISGKWIYPMRGRTKGYFAVTTAELLGEHPLGQIVIIETFGEDRLHAIDRVCCCQTEEKATNCGSHFSKGIGCCKFKKNSCAEGWQLWKPKREQHVGSACGSWPHLQMLGSSNEFTLYADITEGHYKIDGPRSERIMRPGIGRARLA